MQQIPNVVIDILKANCSEFHIRETLLPKHSSITLTFSLGNFNKFIRAVIFSAAALRKIYKKQDTHDLEKAEFLKKQGTLFLNDDIINELAGGKD